MSLFVNELPGQDDLREAAEYEGSGVPHFHRRIFLEEVVFLVVYISYIAPEYSMSKVFSTKSYVYKHSFGVLLEIVSGQRISKLYQSEEYWITLIPQAWKLWVEGKALELMDTCNPHEVLKCINIGLLCVHNEADNWPPMSNVILMLRSEPDTLPTSTDPTHDSQKDHAIASSSGLPKEDP